MHRAGTKKPSFYLALHHVMCSQRIGTNKAPFSGDGVWVSIIESTKTTALWVLWLYFQDYILEKITTQAALAVRLLVYLFVVVCYAISLLSSPLDNCRAELRLFHIHHIPQHLLEPLPKASCPPPLISHTTSSLHLPFPLLCCFQTTNQQQQQSRIQPI